MKPSRGSNAIVCSEAPSVFPPIRPHKASSNRGWAMKNNVYALLLILLMLGAGCRSAKPPPPVPRDVLVAQRATTQAAKLSDEGNWTAAARQWETAADRYFLLNDRTNAAVALHNLGQARLELGDAKAAETTLNEALKINQQLHHDKEAFRNQIVLAQVAAEARETNLRVERLEALSK